IGLPISIVGLITYTAVIVTSTTTPIDNEPFTKGLYRYSRHPMYITQLVMFTGVGIASASWVFLLFSIVYTILSFVVAIPEERECLKAYGNEYREYMNRTPRWIGIPKL
ncbi:isoprenylcysteine carboxylmethyltransferase family protein, partial [candidate division WOR-3 bacterium]|nr:isoprenylcysteine carboxylmethyltransferase family protein [candidate division WOR-3 bacterium]